MSRTKGSGWGGDPILYQKCPFCGKKKVMYKDSYLGYPFKCTSCKEHFNDKDLLRKTFKSQIK